MKNIKTALTILLFVSIFFAFPIIVLSEENILSRIDWNADETLVGNYEDEYATPDCIYIVPIRTSSKEVRLDTEYWMKGLYYFFTTKTQFQDIPFNYIVGWDGKAFEGKIEKRDLIAPVENTNAIVIGYLSNFEDSELTDAAINEIKSLALRIANEYGINPSNVKDAEWSIKPTDDLQKSFLSISNISESSFHTEIASIQEYVQEGYAPKEIKLSAEVIDVTVPEEMEIGEEYEITIKVKNTSDTNWYNDSKYEIVARSEKEASNFSINNIWLSTRSVALMNEDAEVVKVGEESELTFNVSTPFVATSPYTENFKLTTLAGTVLEDSEFEITVNLSTAGSTIVEVTSTPTGFLNIRENPSIGGTLLIQASPGDKFVFLEEQSGWYKILLKDGTEGWATKQYLRKL